MKQILIFILFLALLGCGNIIKKKQTSKNFNCPRVFFSSEDRIYIDNSNSIDDVQIKAEFNNFGFNSNCRQLENTAVIPLDILIVSKPMNNIKESSLSFPVYVSLLDGNAQILETQYFLISGSMNTNTETNNFIETDISDRLEIVTNSLDISEIVIGFMLDDKKRDLLN
tara:strand:- start:873 stop:1379 length:507 start_codon:yes stop_codon:yes gene_type:complete